MVCAVSSSANDLAVQYLLELSTDIRGALLLDREGDLLASAGQLPADDLAAIAKRLAGTARGLSQNGTLRGGGDEVAIEIDVLATGGAMFLLGEAGRMMACVTNRNVHPGLIFYDMHAVLRDLDRAAAAESLRAREGAR
jgi:predicted regulator of Ras-like GTPase activity (Roadblock/LC7/MglB family)